MISTAFLAPTTQSCAITPNPLLITAATSLDGADAPGIRNHIRSAGMPKVCPTYELGDLLAVLDTAQPGLGDADPGGCCALNNIPLTTRRSCT
ncbi:hypothetical protein Q5530_33610 [Saccharothrix sp. BKS2]|uniref:hypothetical protein n=1 Tax=Saccharothrix sp. BKS2 TaxID=3064400 RepID=UPI0039EADD9D